MSHRLSIIIPSHNRPDLLRCCLASVVRHAPGDAEIVVVDDGSPSACVSKAAAEYAGVRLVRLSQRRGFCSAANAGIQAASHPITELLNDDTEVEAGWAEAALRWFDDLAVAAVAPLVLRRGTIIDSAGDRYYIGGVAQKRGHNRPAAAFPVAPQRVFGASASSGFYRRAALIQVGAFPEEFGAYFEDVDLAFRLNRAGYQAILEPRSRVHHHVGASYRPHRRLLEQQSRNEELVFWRNLPDGALWRALPLHLAVLAGKAWRRSREGGILPFLSGRWRALGEWPRVLRHRRELRRLGPDVDVRLWGVEMSYDTASVSR